MYIIDINDIAKIVSLLKCVNCTDYALIEDIAFEMGIRKTMLMQYINDNIYCFKIIDINVGNSKKKAITNCVYNPNPDKFFPPIHIDEWIVNMYNKIYNKFKNNSYI